MQRVGQKEQMERRKKENKGIREKQQDRKGKMTNTER